jgi:glycosyltransferase involved in cell wall biosynthesis
VARRAWPLSATLLPSARGARGARRAETAVRILHLVSYSLYSGPLPATRGLALAQRALGHEVFLAYDVKRGAFNDFEEPAAPRLESDPLKPPVSLTLSAKSSPTELWRDRAALRGLCREGAVDVVHAHLSHDHMLAAVALAGKSDVIRVRTIHAERSLVRRFGQAWLHRRADGWITRARVHRQKLLESFGPPEDRVVVIPSGFDAASWPLATPAERAETRRRFELVAEGLVVVQVALIANRGQKELVSALASLPVEARPQALFVGRGEGEAELRRHVATLGMQSWVRFAGYLQGTSLRLAYAAADAAFLAQPGNDAAARAGLEAMASGVPLVAVSTGALGELVEAERGYALPTREPVDVAAALVALGRDQAEARRRAGRARAYLLAERTFEREARETLALYERVRR